MTDSADDTIDSEELPIHVLLVEDEPDLRSTLRYNLKRNGYAVTDAANGKDALAALQKRDDPRGPVEIIVSDVMMPVMDGISFREAQERDAALSEIPVVVFSAHGNVAETAARMHAAGHLQKPLRAGDLLQTIERAARN